MWKQYRKPNRLAGYDYNQDGFYFVTICTKDRETYFGEIKEGIMELNQWGKIVDQCWREIPDHFKNIFIDEYIVMPNHVHGIILIHHETSLESMGQSLVGTRYTLSLPTEDVDARRHEKIPVVIGSFKASVSRKINNVQHEFQFQWQRSYHDHIIRNDIALQKIRQYILDNPLKWNEDENNPKNFVNLKNV